MTDLKNPSRLDPTVLAARRAQLLTERDHLLDVAGITADELEDVDPEDPTKGRDAVTAGIETMTRTAIAEVTAALARIDGGNYGACADCGTAIPAERLEVMPATRYCVACRQRNE